MNRELLEAAKNSSYLLWESMQFVEPLVLWTCVEDIACYLESNNITEEEDMLSILRNGRYSMEYIDFMRNISYRIYYYTGQKMPAGNWFFSETIMSNSEWRLHISKLAKLFRKGKHDADFVACLHNEKIKEYYSTFIQT